MSEKVTIGGDRLGSGSKMQTSLHNYERSTHDPSYVWKSTMASGTLVPFMKEVALRGDTWEIDLDIALRTHPTIGPLFGSYKVQLDIFSCPFRLYQGKLHMNMLGIGKKMSNVKLPQIVMDAKNVYDNDNAQINPSSIFSYLDIRGLGAKRNANENFTLTRRFNGIPYLAYWDIYKNYYANKQEEIGAVIHNPQNIISQTLVKFTMYQQFGGNAWVIDPLNGNPPAQNIALNQNSYAVIEFLDNWQPGTESIIVEVLNQQFRIDEIFRGFEWVQNTISTNWELRCTEPYQQWFTYRTWEGYIYDGSSILPSQDKPQVYTFPLENLDKIRMEILKDVDSATPYLINQSSEEPFNLALNVGNSGVYSKLSSQEGLALKTYQSDLFNNWVNKEWIDGQAGINAISSIDTTGGSFTMDTFNMSKKVYEYLNRIAITDGSYNSWLNATYTNERTMSAENPIYHGGLIRELGFAEVVSNAMSSNENTEQPLGTLAGKGVLTSKHKGGKVKIRVSEPSYIIGIVSLTPRLDYSQGNKWDVHLQTMDDLHKPAYDGIGFQDLITEQMAWWDTSMDNGIVQKSAGKQPAWVNYMTNVNVTRGNFADKNQQMFMTLNRGYEQNDSGIKDLTTYIDPSKFNNIFADTRLDAQNFWAQIKVDITKRALISAKQMPNL